MKSLCICVNICSQVTYSCISLGISSGDHGAASLNSEEWASGLQTRAQAEAGAASGTQNFFLPEKAQLLLCLSADWIRSAQIV